MTLHDFAVSLIKPVPYIIDVGPGIQPQGFFKPLVHLCIEPHEEYAAWLIDHHFPVIGADLLRVCHLFPPGSVDTIFFMDVIEHMPRPDGEICIDWAIKAARKQVVVFAPLSFHEQSYAPGAKDAWGMDGTYWQTHRSAWDPNDFPLFTSCVDTDFHGPGKGAFYAILTK
jgi:hypothetical protein